MTEPGRQAVAGIIFHRAHFGRSPERIGNALGGPLVVGRETHPHMAIVEDRIVLTIGFFDLVERLGDQESLDAVPRHEGERAFEEIEARSEEHTSELQSLMRISYAVFCLKKKK